MVFRLAVPVLLVAGMMVLTTGISSADSASDLAVITGKKSAVPALTSRDLRSILLGEKERWPSGEKVIAASLPLDGPESKLMLKQICGMSAGDFKRYFMQLTFQGKSAIPPRLMTNSAAVKALVTATPGALGIIRARDVDPSVIVISLDGGSPGASNYKLAMR